MNAYLYLGVDVSHLQLDYAYNLNQKWYKGQIANQTNSIRKWLSGLNAPEICLVLEPTGSYHDRLIQIATELGIAFSLINPRLSYHFALAEGHTSRNDQQAAQTLARIGMTNHPQITEMPNEKRQQRKQLFMSLKAMQKQRQMLKNQLHAIEQYYKVNPLAKKSLESVLQTVEKQIGQIQEELHGLEEEEEKQIIELMRTVVGIGPKSAALMLLYLGNLADFEHSKQVLKFVGVVPAGHTSGTSVKTKERITKHGPTILRATLYIAARSARKHNKACKELYERLRRKGKPYRVAMIAVVAKMLRQVFAVVKTQKPFDNDFYLKYC